MNLVYSVPEYDATPQVQNMVHLSLGGMRSRHKPQSNWSDGKVDHGWPAMSPKVEIKISRHAVGDSWPMSPTLPNLEKNRGDFSTVQA